MQSIEDQMKEIRRRREIYQSMKTLRKKMLIEAVICGVSAAMMIGVICVLSEIRTVSEQASARQYGSFILKMPAAGYVLIGLISFVLGLTVGLLCQQYRKRKELETQAPHAPRTEVEDDKI